MPNNYKRNWFCFILSENYNLKKIRFIVHEILWNMWGMNLFFFFLGPAFHFWNTANIFYLNFFHFHPFIFILYYLLFTMFRCSKAAFSLGYNVLTTITRKLQFTFIWYVYLAFYNISYIFLWKSNNSSFSSVCRSTHKLVLVFNWKWYGRFCSSLDTQEIARTLEKGENKLTVPYKKSVCIYLR